MPVEHPGVSIDEAHADLLYGLVRAHKPASVLELGFGGGKSCDTILRGLKDNETPASNFCLVDNWADWGGERPAETYREGVYFLVENWTNWNFERPASSHREGVSFINESEGTFTLYCKHSFDFIFSDADHGHAQEWFLHTYEKLLNPGGILCYHDVRLYDNLWEIVEECRRLGLRHVVFDKNSIEGEWCERGLLVIFKPME